MKLQLNTLAGVLALVMAGAAAAQTQPAATQTTSTTTQTPTQTQTTTTNSTTTAVPGTPATPAQTETTTTKSTATTPTTPDGTPAGPTQSSTSTTTSTATSDATAAKPATAADVKAGVSVYDASGGLVGKIESVSGKNAVLASGDVKASIPISSFAKNAKGLVIGMTKAEFQAAAKKK